MNKYNDTLNAIKLLLLCIIGIVFFFCISFTVVSIYYRSVHTEASETEIYKLTESIQRFIDKEPQLKENTPWGPTYTNKQLCPGEWAIPVDLVWRQSRCERQVQNPTSSAGGPYQVVQQLVNNYAVCHGRNDIVGINAAKLSYEDQDRVASWTWQGGFLEISEDIQPQCSWVLGYPKAGSGEFAWR